MRLAKLSEFARLMFTPESAPSLDRLRERIDEIPGGLRLGRRYYIDLDEFEQTAEAAKTLEARRAELTKDPLLAGLI